MATTVPPIPAGAPNPAPPAAPKSDPRINNLIYMIRARFSVIAIPSPEEERVIDLLTTWAKASRGHIQKVYKWSVTEGVILNKPDQKPDSATMAPDAALDRVLDTPGNEGAMFIFRDLHHHLNDPAIVRRLRDCAHRLKMTSNTLILLSPRLTVPPDLEKEIAVTDFPLPSERELGLIIDLQYRDFQGNTGDFVDEWSPELRGDVIRACRGLTEAETQDALAKAVIECGGLSEKVVSSIQRTKREAIRRTRCLEAIDADETMANVGGLDNLKAWVRKRQRTWGDDARAYGIDYPKGLLTLGVPGGGKGLSAKAVAHTWRLPLLRLDMGAVFGGIVGESEGNLRSALKITEAIAPCVLWVDEIEKGLAGVGSSDKSDGGTSARVFGSLLTWLQEKTAPVFVYFTANSIQTLPPELLRKGRVDEIFFIDLPTEAERAEILAIHLRKRGRDPKQFDLPVLANECEGFVGAEIEQAVAEALIEAFSEQAKDVTMRHVIETMQRTVPLVKTQRDKIQQLLRFVDEGRAVRASTGQRVELPDSFFSAQIDPTQV